MNGKKMHHQPSKQERWLISYSDFVTLLFALFVVLYAVNNVSIENYKGILHALNIESSAVSKMNVQQIQEMVLSKMPRQQLIEHLGKEGQSSSNQDLFDPDNAQFREESGVLEKRTEDWISIEIRSLFPSARAQPKVRGQELLLSIAKLLNDYNNPISVAGYSDNQPIDNEYYPSNWELSASRAAAVVRVLVSHGVDPDKITAIGYGDRFPVGDNETEEGRWQNRRIVIYIALKGNIEKQLYEFLRPFLGYQVGGDVQVAIKKLRLTDERRQRLPGDF